jgi:glutamate racemase
MKSFNVGLYMKQNFPIGVFDSGVGGLTVLKALRRRLPHEDLLYLGDTARLPYGTKSRETVARYAVQAASKLVERKVKMLVIACNTATASALGDLEARWPSLPVVGVIEPGAKAACTATQNGSIAVIATESTINNLAYHKAIARINPEAKVTARPCSMFVSLAEEGWLDGPVVEGTARRYLEPLFFGQGYGPDCLLLGCTHFPPLAPVISELLGPGVRIVDSAETTAAEVGERLTSLGALNPRQSPGTARFMTTDDADRFARTGATFLGEEFLPEDVELINL